MKGIILAGGTGSRLKPVTRYISKHLLPVYDKPMIYYSLSILMLARIRDILLICTPRDIENYKKLLGDGSWLGISITYMQQKEPRGLAEAFILGKNFIYDKPVCMVLGDNIFYGSGLVDKLKTASKLEVGAKIFAYKVRDPERFGVVEFDNAKNIINIEEKPCNPKSSYAITGLYFFDKHVTEYASQCIPSARGELEITDILKAYLRSEALQVELLGRGYAWLDTGTNKSLMEAGKFVETVERRQGYKIACLEEISYFNGWRSLEELISSSETQNAPAYHDYVCSRFNSE